MNLTVKARRKYGANSLDLTIPAALCRKLEIHVGDIFEVLAEVVDGKTLLKYVKVYKYQK